ncbi:MAG: exosortase/archaeosortase family protein, partial [Methanomicrobia archaeon]|nr:exosortase/archaeosortase family protein [Methanomicrobia archaeon]
LYFRTFTWLINAWLTDPYYSHGFLIPIISGVIAWRNIRNYKKEDEFEPEPFKPAILIFAFGLILYVIGFITVFPFLSALSFLFTASGLILYFYGKTTMRSFLFPVSFLIFAIPLPLLLLEKVAYVLQTVSARHSASIIELLGIPVERMGAEIHLQNAAFIVGLPCSGMNSLISLLALATVFIYILRCPRYKKAVLLSVTIPIAISANVLRVTSLLLLANAYGADTAIGFFHALFSPLLFIIAFIFLILVSIIIGCTVTAGGGGG